MAECLLLADFVAKVGGPLQVRNFRIQRARRLNQCCAAGLFFESMLRVRMRKFFLQQYRHKADKRTQPSNGRYWANNGQGAALGLNGSAAIDPTATLGVHCGNGFNAGFNPYRSRRLSR
jgi:hypothetical protein